MYIVIRANGCLGKILSINLLLLLFSFVFATPEQGGGEAGAKNTKQEQALVDTGRIAGSSNFSSPCTKVDKPQRATQRHRKSNYLF